MKPAFFVWGFAGRIAMLLPNRVAGRTLDLRGPDLARGPEVARRWRKDYTPLHVYLGCVWVVIYVKYITYEGLLHNTITL